MNNLKSKMLGLGKGYTAFVYNKIYDLNIGDIVVIDDKENKKSVNSLRSTLFSICKTNGCKYNTRCVTDGILIIRTK